MSVSSASRFTPCYRIPILTYLSGLAFFAVLTLLLRFDALSGFNSHYIGGFNGDAGLYVWLSKESISSLSLERWFSTHAFYPYEKTLAWSDNFILPGAVGECFRLLGLTDAAAYNLVLLLALFLNGFVTFVTAFRLTNSSMAAVFAGVSFASYGFVTSHAGHPQLQFGFWLPLVFGLTLRALRLRSLTSGLFVGLAVLGAFLCAVYYALFCALLAAVTVGTVVLLHPGRLRPRIREGGLLTLGVLLGLVPLIPFAYPYIQVKEAFGPRGLYEAYYFAADSLSYLSASARSAFYAWTSSLAHDEAHLFGGITAPILGAVALSRIKDAKALRAGFWSLLFLLVVAAVLSAFSGFGQSIRYACAVLMWAAIASLIIFLVRYGRLERSYGAKILTDRSLVLVLFSVAIIFFFLSFGPMANPEKGGYAFAPFAAAYAAIPGFDAVRAVGRMGIVVHLMCSLLAACGIARLERRRRSIGFMLFSVLTLLENRQIIFPFEPAPPPPAVMKILPKNDSAVIVLPLTRELTKAGEVKSWTDFATHAVKAMNWTQSTGTLLFNGYSGLRSKMMLDYARWLRDFPDDTSLNALQRIAGLRYIVYVPDPSTFAKYEFLSRVAAYSDRLSIVADGGADLLLELAPSFTDIEKQVLRFPRSCNLSGIAAGDLRVVYKCPPKSLQLPLTEAGSGRYSFTVDPQTCPLNVIPHTVEFSALSGTISLSELKCTSR